MNHFRLFLYGLGVLMLVISCVTEFQPDTVSIPPSLIIEGQITDQPGPYTVKLTRTADYSYKSLNLLETGAVVTIEDNQGNRETLSEQQPGGVYLTKVNGIRGVAGRSYKLTIATRNGKRYESDLELLRAAPPIQKLYYEYTVEGNSVVSAKNQGWNVYLDMKDPETTGDYYRWDWVHYEPITICQKNQFSDGTVLGVACCSECWDIVRCYNCINVNSDANINGKSISRQFIMRVPYKSALSYYLEVQQQAISKGAYTFWKRVGQLTANTGGLFDAAPASVAGNIRCVSDPATLVFGYFGATGISEQSIYVDRKAGQGVPDLDSPIPVPDPLACAACENNQFRTPSKPRWWVY